MNIYVEFFRSHTLNKSCKFYVALEIRDHWIPDTTAWHVLRLLMEERLPVGKVAVKILNKQPPTANNVWSMC